MKSVIYWFSGTGNSLAIADELAKALGDTTLIPIAKIINQNMQPFEQVGIIFPVYCFGLPLIVRRFLRQAPLVKAKYIYTIANMAGMAGNVHREARNLLAKQNAGLSAGWSIIMPTNYPVLSSPPPREKQERIFAKAEERIKEIAHCVSRGKTGIFEDSSAILGRLLGLIRRISIARLPDEDAKFVVGPNCNHCGLCAKVCPVENIRIVEGKPIWLHHCEQCMACLQWCPTKAINYGQRTAGRQRYHHPRFKAGDLMLREE